jgi:hypothetical protein
LNQPAFTPANKLEEILIAACTDHSARPEFYRLLLESELYLLTPQGPEQEGRTTLETGTQVSFVNLTNEAGPFLPIFTSRERLQEVVNSLGENYGYVVMAGKDVFPLLTQHPQRTLLNPGAGYGKEFTADEIRRLADGSIVHNDRQVVTTQTKVLIGQPAIYPTELVGALQRLFAKIESVQAAYLGWIHKPDSSEPPHLIIGIECTGDMQRISKDAIITAQGLITAGEIVDFIQMGSGSTSIDSYFKDRTKPFYQKAEKKPFWKVW